MKKIFVTAVCILSSVLLYAQSNRYQEVRAYLLNNGYTISNDLYSDLREGQTSYYYKTFYKSITYMVIAFSDDGDVEDVDVCLYEENGARYDCDTDRESAAALSFSPSRQRLMKVVIKNYRSRTPSYASRCRYIIAYK